MTTDARVRTLIRTDPTVAEFVNDLFRQGRSCLCSASALAEHRSRAWMSPPPRLRVWASDPAAKRFQPTRHDGYSEAVDALLGVAADAVRWSITRRVSRRLGPWYQLNAGPSLHAVLNGLPRVPLVLRYAVRTSATASYLASRTPVWLAERGLFKTTVCGRRQWPELARWFARVGRLPAAGRDAALDQRFSTEVETPFFHSSSIYTSTAKPLRFDPLVITVLVAATPARAEVHVHRFCPDYASPTGFTTAPTKDFEWLSPRRRYIAPVTVHSLADVVADPITALRLADLTTLL